MDAGKKCFSNDHDEHTLSQQTSGLLFAGQEPVVKSANLKKIFVIIITHIFSNYKMNPGKKMFSSLTVSEFFTMHTQQVVVTVITH